MENEHNPEQEQDPSFKVVHEGKELWVRPDNSAMYVHKHEWERFDHLFIQLEETNDEGRNLGVYCFRHILENFDEVVEYMNLTGFDVIYQGEPSDMDKKVYYQTAHGKEELNPPKFELTQRQERLAEFVAYLLLHERLTAEDFRGDGAMFI